MLHLLVSSLILISLGSAVRQSLQCYEQTGQRGDEVRAVEYIPYLSFYNFNNRIKSCCFTGNNSLTLTRMIMSEYFRNMDPF